MVELYLTDSTPNKFFLFESFFSLKIDLPKELNVNLGVFNKLVQDITNCGKKSSEEYKPIILLSAIPDMYEEVKNALKYGRETPTPIVIHSQKRKERGENWKNKRNNGVIYQIRGVSQIKDGYGQSSNGKKKDRCHFKS